MCDPIDNTHQAPPSMGFSRQEYWSGLPCPSPHTFLGPDNKDTKTVCLTVRAWLLFSLSGSCRHQMHPGFLNPPATQSDLQASAAAGPSAHHPVPRAITQSITPRDHPRPPHRPGARGLGCGHVNRSLALRAFVSGGVRAVRARRTTFTWGWSLSAAASSDFGRSGPRNGGETRARRSPGGVSEAQTRLCAATTGRPIERSRSHRPVLTGLRTWTDLEQLKRPP